MRRRTTRTLPLRDVFSPSQKERTSWTDNPNIEDLHARWVDKHKSDLYRINSRLGDDLILDFDENPPHIFFRRNLNLSAGILTPNVYFFQTIQNEMAHALLAIYFPGEHKLDVITTYPVPKEHVVGFVTVFTNEMEIPITGIDTARFVSAVYPEEVNLQSNDTETCGPDGGWCLAWTMIFMDWLDAHPAFWTSNMDDRIPIYRQMYIEMAELLKSKTGVRDAWNKIRTGSGRRRTHRSLKKLTTTSSKHRRSRRVKH